MGEPIRFYFDFASPYAWFSLDHIQALAERHGRTVEWRPILVWAVLKAHGVAPPMEAPVKRAYFVKDMSRSAAFHGVPYVHPEKLPLSSHLAARAWHAIAADDPVVARTFGRNVFASFFTEMRDISDETTLVNIAARQGIAEDDFRLAMTGAVGRELLARMIDAAVSDGVCGSPTFIVDGENFFGADRLPLIEWRLKTSSDKTRFP